MSSDPSRPASPPLKRFARLEMDGDPPPPPRPAKAPGRTQARLAAPPTVTHNEPADIVEARRLAAELTANARQSAAQATPAGRRADMAEQVRSRRREPQPSAPMPAVARDLPRRGTAPAATRFHFAVGQLPTMTVDAAAPRPGTERQPAGVRFELPPGATPGVVVMEVDLRGPASRDDLGPTRTPRRDVDDHLGVYAPTLRRGPTSISAAAPIDLTPMAARQVKLMAWEAGLPGSGLRILTSWTPGLGGPECDFAFDDDVQPDDVVFLTHGVRVIVDQTSLSHLRGRRITWHDVPGSEGFLVR